MRRGPSRGRAAVLASLLCAIALAARGQELSLFAGAVRGGDPVGRGIGLSMRYAHDLAGPLFATVTYVNEGHVPAHHRDGIAAQLGLRTTLANGVVLAAAAGPYRYFDTEVAERSFGFADAHGWAALYSLSAAWPGADSRWFYELRVDRVESPSKPDTTMLLAGVGYRLHQDETFGAGEPPRLKGGRDEVVGYLGQTIVNSFDSPASTARSIEYRHAFGPVLRGSLAWLNEGDARLIRRDGVVAQAWLEPTFEHGLFSLGIGYGIYHAVDAYHPERRHDIGLLSASAGYRLARGWNARLTWHRAMSDYDRDSDILLLGLGYRF